MADVISEAIEHIIEINSTSPFAPDGGNFNPALLKSQFNLIADNYNAGMATFVNNLNSSPNKVACSNPKMTLYLQLPDNLNNVDIDNIPENFQFTYDDELFTSKSISSVIIFKLTGKPGNYSFEPITTDQVKAAVKRLLEKATAGSKNPTVNKYIKVIYYGRRQFGIPNIFTALVGSKPFLQTVPSCKVVPCVPDPQPVIDAFANPENE